MAEPLATLKEAMASPRQTTVRRKDPLSAITEAVANQAAPPMSDAVFDQTINGSQGYPRFNEFTKFNPKAWDDFLANAPESQNIDDRRNETVDDFIARTVEAQAR